MYNLDREPQLKDAISDIRHYIGHLKVERSIPGLSVAIVKGKDIIWADGFGLADHRKGIPCSPKTIYRIASLTKIFTATLAMKIREEGSLNLDDPITAHISALRLTNPWCDPQPVTFRQLLSHTSGLPENIPSELTSQKKPLTMKKLVRWLNDEPLRFLPYSQYGYSNTGYALLGYILSTIASRPYEKLIHQRILEPLGMKDTGFEVPAADAGRLAIGYNNRCVCDHEYGTHCNCSHVQVDFNYSTCFNPAGGLYSTVIDLAQFISSQFYEGPAGGSVPLGTQTLTEMQNPVFIEPDWSGASCIGWRTGPIDGNTWIGHMGGLGGFSAEMMAIPQHKLGIVALANQEASIGGICWNSLERLLTTV
jgi:D-alanyl-D-alanine carboxypeptidase